MAAELTGRDRLAYAAGAINALRESLAQKGDLSPEDRRAAGKAIRATVPRSTYATWQPAPDRPDPLALLAEQERDRVQELLPIRHERMAASPFAFFRGSAVVMAADLAPLPRTGITVQCCGDAHVGNFGFFASPERRLVFDINDFDETLPGPWEWDVARLAASLEVLGRDRGFSDKERDAVLASCLATYHSTMRSFSLAGNLDVWYSRIDVRDFLEEHGDRLDDAERAILENAVRRATQKDSSRAVRKLTKETDQGLRFRSQPPLVTPVSELAERDLARIARRTVDSETVIGAVMASYRRSLPAERQALVRQYLGVDMARKVVGVGSVGMSAWVVLLEGNGKGDELVLQLKEATNSVLERYLGASAYANHGQRVIEGQRAMQTSRDLWLGWTRFVGSDRVVHDYYVRQLWDAKGAFPLETVNPEELAFVADMCAWTLAHAHARTGDRHAIAGYLGKGAAFDHAMAAFARAYADQNERDYGRFVAARAAEMGEAPAQPLE